MWIESEDMQIASLKLQEVQPPVPVTTLKQKIFFCCLAAFVGFSLLLGLGTIIGVISLLFS